MSISAEDRASLDESLNRIRIRRREDAECATEAERLEKTLRGKLVRTSHGLYEIDEVRPGYDGGFRARGWKINEATRKRGAKGNWDIGFICARYFDDADREAE